MGIFDLLFSSPAKIYASRIDRIPASFFAGRYILRINGLKQVYEGEKFKAILKAAVKGGISLGKLEEKLKNMGLRGGQYEKRQKVLSIVKENCLDN